MPSLPTRDAPFFDSSTPQVNRCRVEQQRAGDDARDRRLAARARAFDLPGRYRQVRRRVRCRHLAHAEIVAIATNLANITM